MKYLKLLSASLILIGLFSCDSSEQVDPTNPSEEDIYLVKKIEEEVFTQMFYYDDENQLARWMTFEKDKLKQIHDYKYLEDKKREHTITVFEEGEKYVFSDIEIFNEDYHPVHTFGLGITNNNGVVNIEEEESDYNYNSSVAIDKWDCYMKNELVAFAKYKVSIKGNIKSKQIQSLIHDAEQTQIYEYDDQKHYSHFWTYGTGIEPINNNVTKYQSVSNNGHQSIHTSTYEYNEIGLPIEEKRTFKDGRTYTITYEYERR